MSCIPKILELKGDKDFLTIPDYNGIVIECGGCYKGYDYIITFNDMGFRCGYVAIPPTHPLAYSDIDLAEIHDINAHGGITFHDQHGLVKKLLETPCLDKWIGFDAGHAFDIPDQKAWEKYFPNGTEIKHDHIITMANIFSDIRNIGFDCAIRDKDYMEKECISIIDQLIDRAA